MGLPLPHQLILIVPSRDLLPPAQVPLLPPMRCGGGLTTERLQRSVSQGGQRDYFYPCIFVFTSTVLGLFFAVPNRSK